MFLIVAVFGLTWWLGLYVVAREPTGRAARWAGAGLLAYAVALAVEQARQDAAGTAAQVLGLIESAVVCLPVLAWTGACLALLPEETGRRYARWWHRTALPAGLVVIGAVVATGGLFGGPPGTAGTGGRPEAAGAWIPQAAEPPALALAVPAVVLLVPLAGAVALLARSRPGRPGWLLVATSLFFGLGAVLLFFPLLGPPGTATLLATGVDMVLLGVAIAASEAFAAGETLRRDMVRSLLGATAVAVVLGGQVAVVAVAGEATPALRVLLFGVVAAAVAVQTLSEPVHRLLDRVAFAGDRALRADRAELRGSAAALPRRSAEPPLGLEEAEFVRLTRRALAAYGDLPKLTSSPLTNLPVIEARLKARGAGDQPLERAAELKQVLLESIRRLKPREGEFGTSEEWRYYNALYFPYVQGVRPYRRGASRAGLDPVARQAFDWFATQVPERTLYNWQTAAARLVAEDLRNGVGVDQR